MCHNDYIYDTKKGVIFKLRPKDCEMQVGVYEPYSKEGKIPAGIHLSIREWEIKELTKQGYFVDLAEDINEGSWKDKFLRLCEGLGILDEVFN